MSPDESTHKHCIYHEAFSEKIKTFEGEIKDMKKDILESKISTKVVIAVITCVTPIISGIVNFALQHWIK